MRHENGVLSIITELKLRKAKKFPFQQENSIHAGVLSIMTQLKLRKGKEFPFQQESYIHSLTLIENISTCD